MTAQTSPKAPTKAPSSQEWERSPAAATLLYLPLAELAGKFAAEHSTGSILEREQSRLLSNLAAHVQGMTGGAA